MSVSYVLSWCELGVSISATPLVIILLIIVLPSSLHKGCKTFVCMNTLGLLGLTLTHSAVAISRLINPVYWGTDEGMQEVIFNIPLFTHQLSYTSCLASLLLISIERLIIGINPEIYVRKKHSTFEFIFIAVMFEALIGVPLAVMMQYVSVMTQKFSIICMAGCDSLALAIVVYCYYQSTKGYSKRFARSTLTTRYQVQEVISLTRVLIPICISSIIIKFMVVVLAYVALTYIELLDTLFTIIRFCCTATSIIEPLFFLSRHKLMAKRFRKLLGLQQYEVTSVSKLSSEAVTSTYFTELQNEWKSRR